VTSDESAAHLFSFRITNLSPDHFSSTAHTFTSTKPNGKAASRMVSSVISVGRFAAFLYHETQSPAVGLIDDLKLARDKKARRESL